MKKKALLILVLLLAINIGFVLGQPTPGDSGLGASGGNPVGHHGGGAELGHNFLLLIISSVLYMAYKFRREIHKWYASMVS